MSCGGQINTAGSDDLPRSSGTWAASAEPSEGSAELARFGSVVFDFDDGGVGGDHRDSGVSLEAAKRSSGTERLSNRARGVASKRLTGQATETILCIRGQRIECRTQEPGPSSHGRLAQTSRGLLQKIRPQVVV